MARIPFTFAEPGTDPTRQPNPIRHKRGLNDMVPYGLAIAAFILAGWWFFIRDAADESPTAQVQPPAAPTIAAATAAPTIALPTATGVPSPTPTITPIPPPPTPAPTPAPPNVLTYAVYQDGETVNCWCNTETLFWGDNIICQAYLPSDCGGAP